MAPPQQEPTPREADEKYRAAVKRLVIGEGTVALKYGSMYFAVPTVRPRLQCLTDLDVAISSANIGGPDGDLVEVVANLNHSTVDVVAELVKALSYQTQQDFEPVIVQPARAPQSRLSDDPPSPYRVSVGLRPAAAAFDRLATAAFQRGRGLANE
ncbi:hypothetical protein HPB52_020806 [Rhipicephalus sanguineus]|uniref:Uncharacterized protein n=1 Tax=Rhipicephalus sanguineus TaxID=34632 RepID=A0A9D4T1Z0_RHISA|nr:hypothetical protein HPB52_020806 [Rhipicephalus sanguineus]